MEVVPLCRAPSCLEAEAIIKKLTAQGAICWTSHCRQRMRGRGVTMPQILNCLAKGKVREEPVFSYKNGGGYETSVEKNTAGESLKVVVCIKLDEELLMVTVY